MIFPVFCIKHKRIIFAKLKYFLIFFFSLYLLYILSFLMKGAIDSKNGIYDINWDKGNTLGVRCIKKPLNGNERIFLYF